METLTPSELIKKIASKKNKTLYQLAVDTGRFPSSLYTTLKHKNVSTNLFIELMDSLDEDTVLLIDKKKYKLIIKTENDERK